MALKGKPVAIGNTATTIYTCPSGTEAAVHGLLFSNNTGGALTVDVSVYTQADGASTTVATDLSVPANSYITWSKPVNLNAGDSISATSSAASGLVCLFSAYEGSAAPVATGFTGRGVWSSAASYAVNDIVTVVGTGTYLALQASTNQDPTTATAYWMFLEGISASALPSQAGQAGKYLTTDGTDASWAALDVAGGGTVTSPMSADVTLTSASTRVQVFVPDAARTVTLPAASSLSEGESFVIANKGDFSISIRNDSGALLAVAQPARAFKFLLADQATTDWEAFSVELGGGLAPLVSRNIGITYSSSNIYNTLIYKVSTNKYHASASFYAPYGHRGEYFTIDNSNNYNSIYVGSVGFDYPMLGYQTSNAIISIDTGLIVHNGYQNNPPNYRGRTTLVEQTESSTDVRYTHYGPDANEGYYFCSPMAKVATRKSITFYTSGSSLTTASFLNITAQVFDFTSSLTTPTVGSAVTFATGGTNAPNGAGADQLEDNKGILVYNQRNGTTAPSYAKRAVVWSVSGTTPSFGSSIELSTAVNNAQIYVRAFSSSGAIAYWRSNSGAVVGKILSISGTTITASSEFQLTDSLYVPTGVQALSGESGSVFYVIAQNSGDNNCWYMSKVTVSGASLVSQTPFAKISPVTPLGFSYPTASGFYDSEKAAMILHFGAASNGPSFISVVQPTAI